MKTEVIIKSILILALIPTVFLAGCKLRHDSKTSKTKGLFGVWVNLGEKYLIQRINLDYVVAHCRNFVRPETEINSLEELLLLCGLDKDSDRYVKISERQLRDSILDYITKNISFEMPETLKSAAEELQKHDMLPNSEHQEVNLTKAI